MTTKTKILRISCVVLSILLVAVLALLGVLLMERKAEPAPETVPSVQTEPVPETTTHLA